MRILVLIAVLFFSLTSQSQSFKVDSFFANSTQKGTLSGKILDEDAPNEGLALADILVKDTDITTASDINGNFDLQLKPGKYTLVVSFIGYQTVEIKNVEVFSEEITQNNITMSPLQLSFSVDIASLP